ncbi:hypothetical protein [Candidatus Methanoprimaticola sp. MG2]|uniref:hypothetical protein n=1 Tax=Candidatus Methanoprimaticola sp. MG2 TaxID=3228838 RepID=UPI0039C608E0
MSDPAFEAITKARNQASSGNPTGAANTLERYLETDPHNTRPRLVLAEIAVHSLNDVEYGLMQLNVILDLEPDNVDAMKAMTTVLAKDKRNNKKTSELFERIVVLSPTAESYNAYARFLRNQMTDFRKAAEYYEKAIALDPNEYTYHQNYAVLLLNDIRDYAKAKEELETLMELKPADASVRKNYDRLLKEKFDKDGNPKKSFRDRFRK